jgi:peptidoglycan hydrolase-like protein with peptidoglycan-binding domain
LIKHRDRVAERLSPDQLAVAESAPPLVDDPVERPALTPSIAEIQQTLADRSFKPGPIDGQMGRRTTAALSAFQAAYGLAITGQADEPTLQHLFGPDEVAPRLEPFPRVVVIPKDPVPEAVPVPTVETTALDSLIRPAEAALFPSIDSGLSAGMLEPGNPWVAVESEPPSHKQLTAEQSADLDSETDQTDLGLSDYKAAEYEAVETVAGKSGASDPGAGERSAYSLIEDADGGFAIDRGGLNGAATATVELNDSKFDGWREEDRISLIQRQLSEAGFDPGPIDGEIGPQTRAALEAYQHSYNLIDQTFEELLDYMAASAIFESAYHYQKLGYHEKSIKEYSMAIHIRSNFPEAYFNRGLIYHAQDRYDRAIEDFSAVINLQPKNKGAHLSRANAYYEKGSYGLAAQDVFDAVILGVSTW